MATKQGTRTLGKMLRDKRDDRYATEVADELGVSRQIYPHWEKGHVIPGDEWVEALADYFDLPEEEVVMIRYRSWKEKRDRETLKLRVLGRVTYTPQLRAA